MSYCVWLPGFDGDDALAEVKIIAKETFMPVFAVFLQVQFLGQALVGVDGADFAQQRVEIAFKNIGQVI